MDVSSTHSLEVLLQRVEVLERLVEGPSYRRDLSDELGVSRSTIDRAVRELEELQFVENCRDGVRATAAGRNAIDHLANFQDRTR